MREEEEGWRDGEREREKKCESVKVSVREIVKLN